LLEAPLRKDVLTFTSKPLTEHVMLTGAVTATMYVMSDRNDTDFTAKLTDVYPKSLLQLLPPSRLIADGILRMRWRRVETGHQTTASPIEPHTLYEVNVSLWNTSYVFIPGHRIRVSISSSNYPRFDVNPNTGAALSSNDTTVLTAHNTVFHSAQYASHINLPTVTADQVPVFKLDKLLSNVATTTTAKEATAMTGGDGIRQRLWRQSEEAYKAALTAAKVTDPEAVAWAEAAAEARA
jgi:hypothetical protein